MLCPSGACIGWKMEGVQMEWFNEEEFGHICEGDVVFRSGLKDGWGVEVGKFTPSSPKVGQSSCNDFEILRKKVGPYCGVTDKDIFKEGRLLDCETDIMQQPKHNPRAGHKPITPLTRLSLSLL